MASIKKRPDDIWRARHRNSDGREHPQRVARKVDATRRDQGRFLRRADDSGDDNADDNADDNPAPSAQSGTGPRCNRRRDGRVACSWGPSDRRLVITLAPGCHCVTAVLTATSSTVSHSNTTQRTPHAHVPRSDQGPACIC